MLFFIVVLVVVVEVVSHQHSTSHKEGGGNHLFNPRLGFIYGGGSVNPINSFYHMFVTTQTVSTDPALNQLVATLFTGVHRRPTDPYIEAEKADFAPPHDDYFLSRGSSAIFVDVLLPGSCDQLNQNLQETVNQINQARIGYELGLPYWNEYAANSNAVAYTLLRRISLSDHLGEKFINKAVANPATIPVGPLGTYNFVPGWGRRLV